MAEGCGVRVAAAGGRTMVVGGFVWLAAIAWAAVTLLVWGWSADDDVTVVLSTGAWLLVLAGTGSLFALFAIRNSVLGGAGAACIAVGVLLLPAFLTGVFPMLIGAIVVARALGGVGIVLVGSGAFVVTFVYTGAGDPTVVAGAGLALMGLGWVALGAEIPGAIAPEE